MNKRRIERAARSMGGNVHRARRIVRALAKAASSEGFSLYSAGHYEVNQDAYGAKVTLPNHTAYCMTAYSHLELVENARNAKRLGMVFAGRCHNLRRNIEDAREAIKAAAMAAFHV